MPLEDTAGGIAIQNIDGLGPVKATIVSSSFATTDGVQYLSAKREPRNLVFQLGLVPDPFVETVSAVRRRLYSYFMPKTNVDLQFTDDSGLVVNISGMIETCEPAIFSKDPAINVGITCFKPEFIDPTIETLAGSTVTDTTDQEIELPEGTVETGMTFQLLPNRDIDEFTIFSNLPSGLARRLDFAYQMHAGDTLTIVTIPGEKSITLLRGSVPQSLLYGMTPQSSWIDFYPGVNTFRVYAEGAAVPYVLSYYNRYGGL
jgi:hypothetical protein